MGINVLLEGKLGTMTLYKDFFIHNFDYRLLTFHTPAEHTIEGQRMDMEMQIVFEKAESSKMNIDASYKQKDKGVNDRESKKIDESEKDNPLIPNQVIISVLFAESHQESEFLNQLQIPNMPNKPGFKKNID